MTQESIGYRLHLIREHFEIYQDFRGEPVEVAVQTLLRAAHMSSRIADSVEVAEREMHVPGLTTVLEGGDITGERHKRLPFGEGSMLWAGEVDPWRERLEPCLPQRVSTLPAVGEYRDPHNLSPQNPSHYCMTSFMVSDFCQALPRNIRYFLHVLLRVNN
jgi:hypothetical protein